MERDLRDLLELHPPPWSETPDVDLCGARDGNGKPVPLGIPPELRLGLVAAVNVAADYLSVIDDMLEESAELAEESPAEEPCAVAGS